MQYVNLGKSGLKVSRICLGAMTYGTPSWRPWVLDETQARPIIQRAVELGINFFDTANMYSNGLSEELLGRALRDFSRREDVVIGTKVYFPMGDAPNRARLVTPAYHALGGCLAAPPRYGLYRPVPDRTAMTRIRPLKRLCKLCTTWFEPAKCATLALPACTPGSLPAACTWQTCMAGRASSPCRTITT